MRLVLVLTMRSRRLPGGASSARASAASVSPTSAPSRATAIRAMLTRPQGCERAVRPGDRVGDRAREVFLQGPQVLGAGDAIERADPQVPAVGIVEQLGRDPQPPAGPAGRSRPAGPARRAPRAP